MTGRKSIATINTVTQQWEIHFKHFHCLCTQLQYVSSARSLLYDLCFFYQFLFGSPLLSATAWNVYFGPSAPFKDHMKQTFHESKQQQFINAFVPLALK